MARIRRSHRRGPGSIPGTGVFFPLFQKSLVAVLLYPCQVDWSILATASLFDDVCILHLARKEPIHLFCHECCCRTRQRLHEDATLSTIGHDKCHIMRLHAFLPSKHAKQHIKLCMVGRKRKHVLDYCISTDICNMDITANLLRVLKREGCSLCMCRHAWDVRKRTISHAWHGWCLFFPISVNLYKVLL